jgi:hypothetical protein
MGGVKRLPIRNIKEYKKAREDLILVLQDTTIPKIPKSHVDKHGKMVRQRDMIIGTIGRTMTFGYGKTRTKGYAQFAANAKYPELLDALVEFGNRCVPRGFFYNVITLNYGVKAKKHVDSVNVGESVIVGIGNYTGGDLFVYSPDSSEKKAVNIHDHPLMFNGAIYPHQTDSFEGDRWTIIYYKQHGGETPITGHKTVGLGYDEPEEPEVEGGVMG